MDDQLSPTEFLEATGGDDWRVVGDGACAFFRTGALAESARLVQAIADELGDDGAPDLDDRAGGVTVRLITATSDFMGMTGHDAELARRISAVARREGAAADPSRVASFLVIVGAGDVAQVMPFWEAALGYVRRPDSPEEDLVDPGDRLPGFWFEAMDEPRGDGEGAIHVAVWIPPEQAEERVAAALAAGGRLVRDVAPSWWTLADAAGNEVDVSTIQGRG
jgi:4a-hydroxytetrahydrobiopterin dehydratase